MVTKKQVKKVRKASSRSRSTSKVDGEDAITPEKLIGVLNVAYVLETAGLLDAGRKNRLDELNHLYDGPAWDKVVEEEYGIDREYVRGIYEFCAKRKDPLAAIVFILGGLGCPDYVDRLKEFTDH